MTHEKELLMERIRLFERNHAQYKSGAYDEANTKTDFVDRLFECLGWDIANKQGFSETYREVVREDKVKIDGFQKAPDYSFRIGGIRKFFVEAKKPSANLKDAAMAAYQVRRYGYTAKLPLSILTNFEEFAVYDTRIKPDKNDKAGTARIFYCTYNQYEQYFDFINNLFSKDAILKGSFERYVGENKNKRGTSEVDDDLLELAETWRMELAKSIARNNPALSIEQINTSVQRIIDRIIFLRIAEDKGIEAEQSLLTAARSKNIYRELIGLFKKADKKYNAGLFVKTNWINNIIVEDKVLSNIITSLYYPECPYEFSVLPIEILGSMYERFLGKTIHFHNIKGGSHTVKIEEKPEVKKAGGVYYTPQYIVDYIVKNTVGQKIENKSPEEIAKIKICDPACGSGSFLIGAYQYLLNYHFDYYTHPRRVKAALTSAKIYEIGPKSYKLTIAEKQRILQNCIFGVDIDRQAVEVTKLSLYLKLLENEGEESEGQLFKHSDLTLLPPLEGNIKCGNSLVGSDFYARTIFDLTDDECAKVNWFDWEKEFADILKAGGFDVIVGNPPWVSLSGKFGNDIYSQSEIDYLQNTFTMANTSMPNLYEYFLYKGFNLLRNTGFFGYIIPDRLASNAQFLNLRKELLSKTCIKKLVFRAPFPNITTDTLILVYQKGYNNNNLIEIGEYEQKPILIKQNEFERNEGLVFVANTNRQVSAILKKIANLSGIERLAALYSSTSGFGGKSNLITTQQKSSKQIPILKGASINRYMLLQNFWFEFKSQNITGRTTDKNKLGYKPKILIRKTGDSIIAMHETTGIFPEQSLYFLYNPTTNLAIEYILGILNSKVISFYYREKLITNKNSIAQIKKVDLDKLPVPVLNLAVKSDKIKHDNIVSLVYKMLKLKQKENVETKHSVKALIVKQIESVDAAIDAAVYELYGLGEREIKIIEREK